MTNTNDKDVDLRLALGSRNYSAETRLYSTSGAGVNAKSRVDMPFAASDPLSELVWSPHNGLSLKRANSTLAESKPFLTWNLGEPSKNISTSQSIRSKGGGDIKASDEEKLSRAPIMLDGAGNPCDKAVVFRSSGGSSSSDLDASQRNLDANKMEKAGTTHAIQDEKQGGNAGEDLRSSQTVQIADIAESSKRTSEENGRLEIHAMCLAVPIHSELHAAKAPEAHARSLPHLQSREKPDNEVTSASGHVNKNKTKQPISIPPPTFIRLESSAENDLRFDKAPTNNRICLYQEKEKEKASSEGDICARSSNDEDNSHESVESCSSAGLLSRGIKRQNCDQMELFGRKRMRKQTEGSHDSSSIIKPNSSFMNWISNMVKGISDSNKEEPSPLALTLANSNNGCSNNHLENSTYNKVTECARPVIGFQTVFQSLYYRSTKGSDSGVRNDDRFVAESGELVVADSKSLENLPEPLDWNNNGSCKQIVLSDKEATPDMSSNPSKPWIFSPVFARTLAENKASRIPECKRVKGEVSPSGSLREKVDGTAEKMSPDIPLPMNCEPGKRSPCSNLWITRLYTRTAPLENCDKFTQEARNCSSDSLKANLDGQANDVHNDCARDEIYASSFDFKSTHKLIPIQLPEKSRSSEAMASVFAKRLDALKHIIPPSEKQKSPPSQPICFFCGQSGHDLRSCLELTETELENLLVKIRSFHMEEESPCLCIRCFQVDHWAISCPLVSSDDHKQAVSGQVACSAKPISGSFPGYLTWDVNESSRERLLSSNEFQKSTSSSSGHHLKERQIFPPHNFVDARDAVSEEEIFDVIRKLRLSRADILRCMKSNVPISRLNGFFLRLRLGTEGCLGETSYYVACITGATTENISCKPSMSILVDVGGIKSSVGSQYISNHDFLKDEITAWWSRIVKTGGKIPSIDKLNSKFDDRKRLGL